MAVFCGLCFGLCVWVIRILGLFLNSLANNA